MKKCFKCEEVKPFDEFYKHSQMGDGRLNKCKECAKRDTNQNRAEKHWYYVLYDRARANLPHRVEQRKEYAKSKRGAVSNIKAKRQYNIVFTEKAIARNAVNNAVRDGRLKKPNNCSACGDSSRRIHGHHDDYSKHLEVRWLCPTCHGAHHAEVGDMKRYNYGSDTA